MTNKLIQKPQKPSCDSVYCEPSYIEENDDEAALKSHPEVLQQYNSNNTKEEDRKYIHEKK